jgi:hypothetical protein
MNSGQTFLIIGAFVLLSTMTLNVNSTLIVTSTTGLEMEATLDAMSIGQTLVDEILTQDFDQKATGGVRVYSPDSLTPPSGFGPDGAAEKITGNQGIDTSSTDNFQSLTRFNDVDDYNGYCRKSWNPRFGWFTITVHIDYTDEDNPYVLLSKQSFYKRISVTVTHPNLMKDIKNNVIPVTLQDIAVYRRFF